MSTNPYDQLVVHDVDDLPARTRRVVSLRAALIGCLLSALAGSGATWATLTLGAAPLAGTVHPPASHFSQLNERNHP